MPETEVEETMLILLELSSEILIDHDAVLVKETLLAERGSKVGLHCVNKTSLGCNRCQSELLTLKTNKASEIGTERANDSKPKEEHDVEL